jgi:exopolyphosphatase/guanosine-5'-triphosphate,3'-diphosphate pyrophosphatase
MGDRAGPVTSASIGVVDIGSNSIRLVVFDRPCRAPWVVFNEKVLCGLGRGLDKGGRLNESAMTMAAASLERFVRLAEAMSVATLHMVATAAVRDAKNGRDFVKLAERRCGRAIQVLSGEEEARLSALGVVSGMPDASGAMGDLGGGSLELVALDKGAIGDHATLPLGPLRLVDASDGDRDHARKLIDRELERLDWLGEVKGRAFVPVGGAWRSLARIHMDQTRYPLHVIHQYEIGRRAAEDMARVIARLGRRSLASIRGVSRRRLESLPLAALVLERVLRIARPQSVIFSAYGLREGLMHSRLAAVEQRKDPLIEAAAEIAGREARFGSQGQALVAWTAPLFPQEDATGARLRRAVAELSDIGWREHPDYRAEQGFLHILRLPVAGLDHRERVFLAAAIAARYGAELDQPVFEPVLALLDETMRQRALVLGLGLRLAYSLSAGTPSVLARAALERSGQRLTLKLAKGDEPMFGEAVQRRLEALGRALDLPIGTGSLPMRRTA